MSVGEESIVVIAGPCAMESRSLAMTVAERLHQISKSLRISFIFKASFDKANRSSVHSDRGMGLEDSLPIFEEVRDTFNLKITTDIHEPHQAEKVKDVVDLIQIPAFLCRQTDLLKAAAHTGKAVSVKKGQFLSPESMSNVVDKLKHFGCNNIILMERGTFFGYGRLVNDMTAIPIMKDLGVPVVFDATHSVQMPTSLGAETGGNREFVEPLAKAAVSVGADGLFFETHPDPEKSISDGQNTIKLSDFESMLERVLGRRYQNRSIWV